MEVPINLVLATEKAAIAASSWIGSGQKEEADKAATDAMRKTLNSSIEIATNVVIGEGIKDKSFGLFRGETLGKKAKVWENNPTRYNILYGKKPYWLDMVVDPLEGTTPTVTSGPEAMCAIALGSPNSMFHTHYFYMNRIVYGKKIKDKVNLSLDNPIEENLRLASEATGKPIPELKVCVLDRPRHKNIINCLRKNNVRIKLLRDCDISGAIAACLPNSDVDFLYGIGGSPEAVISAAAIKSLQGCMEAQIYEKNLTGKPCPIFTNKKDKWYAIGDVLPIDRMIAGTAMFVGTGVTKGSILDGVKNTKNKLITHSVYMKSDTREVRFIRTYHNKNNK